MSLALKVPVQSRVWLSLPDGRVMWILVSAVGPGSARLAIEAPPDVKVLREGLLPEEVRCPAATTPAPAAKNS